MSARPLPLVSIVTPSFNMAQYLPKAIESVLSQDYPRIEYIVVDGGSTDATGEILRAYGDRLRLFTGKDGGPSDAAHRGFREATGEIFGWLNADDTYLPGAIRTGVEHLLDHPEVDVVYGEANWINEQGGIIRRYPTQPFDAKALERDCFICQPASFIRASSYRRCGLDPAVNRSFDYDLWIRMANLNLRFASIPQYLANSRMHSGAKTLSERGEVFRASMRLLVRHYGYIPFPWVFGYTAYCLDQRDQFFQPLRPSLGKYVTSLPMGLSLNRAHRFRFLCEWLAAPWAGLKRRLQSRSGSVASL